MKVLRTDYLNLYKDTSKNKKIKQKKPFTEKSQVASMPKKDEKQKGFLDLLNKNSKEVLDDEEIILKCTTKEQPLVVGKALPDI